MMAAVSARYRSKHDDSLSFWRWFADLACRNESVSRKY